MNSNITINIVEPGTPPSPTPIDPAIPNTGLFTSGASGPEATIITAISAVLILTIVAIVITSLLYRKQKKSGKVTKLVHLVDSTKAVLKSNKHITTAIILLAILTSTGTFITLAKNAVNASENDEQSQTEDTNDSSLTVDVSSEELTIEVADTPVFAILPVEVTVEEATEAGYTLTASTNSTDLVSTTNPDNIIPMVTLPESSAETLESSETAGELTALTDNTYGLALEKPTTKDEAVYTSLSIDPEEPTILKSMPEYTPTEENDTTTIYYGFYITPDMPYGTYIGGEVEYKAEENKVATVTFDGNGLYFDDNREQTTNIVKYIPGSQSESVYSHTPNLNDEGVQDGVYGTNLNETFVYSFPNQQRIYFEIIKGYYDAPWTSSDYFSIWSGNHPDYTALENWDNDESIKELGSNGKYNFDRRYNNQSINIPSNTITLAYATDDTGRGADGNGYGYYARITAYTPNTELQGDYETPLFAYDSYNFIGWSEDKDATTATYANQEEIARKLDLSGGDVTLYAIFQRANTIVFDGNGSDDGEMQNQVIWSNTAVPLNQNTYSKSDFGFVEWNTKRDGSGTSYTDRQEYVAGDEVTTVTLYAQWRCNTYHIGYNGNGDDGTINMKNIDTFTAKLDGTASIDLMAPNFKKAGYGFVGWSEDKDAWRKLTDDDGTNDPVIYGPNETFTLTESMIDRADGNTIPFYAIWAPAEKDASGNPVYLQNWAGCSTLTPTIYNEETNSFTVGKNTIIVLTDNRDNNTYTIARLSDGNCWMTENFRMGFDQATKLTTENTQSAGTIPAATSDWSNGSSGQKISIENTTETATSPVYSYDADKYVDPTLNDKIYSYGGYYTWHAAINTTSSYNADVNAPGSICPSGWQLPKGNNVSGSFLDLGASMGGGMGEYSSQEASKRWRSFPNNFILAGLKGSSDVSGRGYLGHYISSTAGYSYQSYHYGLEIKWWNVFNRNTLQRYNGYPIRCVTLTE